MPPPGLGDEANSTVPSPGALLTDVVSQVGDPVALDDPRVAEEQGGDVRWERCSAPPEGTVASSRPPPAASGGD
jgi:hypothetical protein